MPANACQVLDGKRLFDRWSALSKPLVNRLFRYTQGVRKGFTSADLLDRALQRGFLDRSLSRCELFYRHSGSECKTSLG